MAGLHQRFLRLRTPPDWIVRVACALASGAFALRGLALFDESRANFDQALAWYAVALAFAVAFAWDGTLAAGEWTRRLAAFVRVHWVEGAFLTGILAFAAFLRLYRFGDYPPADLFCCADGELWAVGGDVLDGGRPLVFPLVHYSTALGFLLFGENTTGLRVPPLVLGVVTIVPFYLLLRQLVRAPAALFAAFLLASSRLFLDVTTRHQPTILEATLVALFLVYGLRTGSALMFLGLGVMSALLSYEYEGYKHVPILALGYIAVAGAYVLIWPRTDWRGMLERARSLTRRAWRPAVAFCLGAGIVIGPLVSGTLAGDDLYFRRLNQRRTAQERGAELSLVPGDWAERLEWSGRQLLPYGSGEGTGRDPYYDPARNRPLLDPLVGALLVLATAWGIMNFRRPFRLFFVGWLLATLVGGALTVALLNTARLIGALLPGFVLIAFLIDDAQRLLSAKIDRRMLRFPAVILVVAACYVGYWNASTFNAIADDPQNRAVFTPAPEDGFGIRPDNPDPPPDSGSYGKTDGQGG